MPQVVTASTTCGRMVQKCTTLQGVATICPEVGTSSLLAGKAFSALLPNSLTRYAREKSKLPKRQYSPVCWGMLPHCVAISSNRKGFGMLPNKSLQGKGLCTYKDTACSAYGGTMAHCLQVLGPLQEHTTFRESLVCYTSPPGGVDAFPSLWGRHSGWRSK